MLSWIQTGVAILQTGFKNIQLLVDFFLEHLYPIFVWLYSVVTDDTLNGFFPVSLGALAATVGICMLVRFLWNAGRGAGA